jgi:transposase-like protein
LGRVCTICSHEQRFAIEELLATRQSTYRGIARKYGVSEDAVSRHVKAGHVSQLLALAADAERAARADTLLDRIEALQSQTLAILDAPEDQRTALAAIREARHNLVLLGEATKELDRAGTINTINLSLNPEWLELRGVIVAALGPHPAARDSVLRALEGGGNNGRA